MPNSDKLNKALNHTLELVNSTLHSKLQCHRMFFEKGDTNNHQSYFQGVCDICNTLLILPENAEDNYECPTCTTATLNAAIVNSIDAIVSIPGDRSADLSEFDPSYIKHFTWRECILNVESGKIDLIAPHSDPNQWEEPFGVIFESRNAAFDALDTYEVRAEAMCNKWVLLTIEAVNVEDPFTQI